MDELRFHDLFKKTVYIMLLSHRFNNYEIYCRRLPLLPKTVCWGSSPPPPTRTAYSLVPLPSMTRNLISNSFVIRVVPRDDVDRKSCCCTLLLPLGLNLQTGRRPELRLRRCYTSVAQLTLPQVHNPRNFSFYQEY